MNDMNIKDLIDKNSPYLSKGQKKIAGYIAENLEKCGYMKAAAIAAAVGVSEATVVRFACAVGFDGFPELSQAIRDEAKSKLTSLQRMELVSERIGNDDILYNVLHADIERIEKTIDVVDKNMFSGAVAALIQAENVYVAGVRSAAGLASFAAFYFNVLFKGVKRISNSMTEDVVEQMLHVNEKDVVLGISFPRYSSAMVRAMAFAKKRGAKVIALTDSENAPIVRYADFVLIAKSDMDSFADSLVAPLSIINAIIFAAASMKKDEIKKTFCELEDIWREYDVYDV